MMPSQMSAPTYIMGGPISREHRDHQGFWTKMATALAITQLMIGISCVAFHVVAFYIDKTDKTVNQPLHYIGEGLLTGGVIIIAGVFGLASSKKKTNCTIITFLVLSVLAGLFALFPMVFGIMGATMMFGESESLMMPISQLVLATVEIIVATWSIGVSSQAICCPNSALSQSANRMMGGAGLTQFVASGEGQHVVIFSAGAHQPAVMYAGTETHMPYLVQHGIPGVQLTGLVATNGAHMVPTSIHDHQMAQEVMSAHQGAVAGISTTSGPAVVVGANQDESEPKPAEDGDEKSKLLEEEDDVHAVGVQVAPPVIHIDPPPGESGFEIEDEKAHLLSLDESM